MAVAYSSYQFNTYFTFSPKGRKNLPAYYLFDAEGKLKSFAAGERGTAMLGSALNRVLGVQS